MVYLGPPTMGYSTAEKLGGAEKSTPAARWTIMPTTQGLMEMQRPENVGELQQFIHGVNWMRTVLPNLAEVETPLKSLLEGCLRHTSRTNRVAT